MSMRAKCLGIAVFLVAGASAGCTGPRAGGEIPLGEWAGEGTYVLEDWVQGSNATIAPSDDVKTTTAPAGWANKTTARSGRASTTTAPSGWTLKNGGHAEYPTSLSIRPERLDGHDVVVLRILSEHEKSEPYRDDVHLLVALEKTKRLSPQAAAYRIVAFDADSKPGQKPSYRPGAFAASLAYATSRGGVTTLVIWYKESLNLYEVYRFEGSRLEKAGSFVSVEPNRERSSMEFGFVHWSEQLRRR